MRSLLAISLALHLGACSSPTSSTAAPPTLSEVPPGLDDTSNASVYRPWPTLLTTCATASSPATCHAALDALVPSPTGWGYCGEGCWDDGLIATRGDSIEMADSPDEVATWLSPIDTVSNALFIATTLEYAGECESVRVLPDQSYVFDATIMTSDCPVTHERRRLRIDTDGALLVLGVWSIDVTDGCIQRRRPRLIASSRPQPALSPSSSSRIGQPVHHLPTTPRAQPGATTPLST